MFVTTLQRHDTIRIPTTGIAICRQPPCTARDERITPSNLGQSLRHLGQLDGQCLDLRSILEKTVGGLEA